MRTPAQRATSRVVWLSSAGEEEDSAARAGRRIDSG